ncbi:MAG: glycerate kinase [Gluconobacter potus]|uniref:Glycerate kinase n=1 Tax=Gluconobacter potus TaxID=2724927 RepID=A0ABR9YNZ6_9PROT|nr:MULTISPECIES: glycerate kinase [Gluconobacter]MBF0865196.1 glycerate kinase [Gluconobacter sp. R71656]MBF0868294.1 glycerate kinase [Gluconobacter sp. R75628]MBF0874334.1 glycerate kinase [Gluconobacter sp. R75629]MBF0883267.1 glycerate kinase [Gluconobacter potus]
MMLQDRMFLTGLFDAAVGAAEPEQILAAHLPEPPKGRTVVVGAGKGVAQLAAAFERVWRGPLSGVVVTRYGNVCPTQFIRVMEASHPVPDEAGLKATEALFETVKGLGPDDLVVALICGGGSALLPSPPPGMTLEDEAELNRVLLASGAPISVMNSIRKQVSGIKGGRLAAAAAPAKVVSLVVSDVPFDDPAQVASGPTVPDLGTREDARRLAKTWKLRLPEKVQSWLEGEEGRAPLATDPVFSRNEVRVIASAHLSLEAAAEKVREAGIYPVILSDAIEGESRDVAKVHAAMVREVILRGRPFRRPVVILSGGETTVTIRGQGGRGGRNTEFLLAFALAAEGLPFSALAADTDGIDGSEDNAGAFADGVSMERLREKGFNPTDLLMENDAYTAFEALGDLFVPGPTGTNVNDFRAVLVR